MSNSRQGLWFLGATLLLAFPLDVHGQKPLYTGSISVGAYALGLRYDIEVGMLRRDWSLEFHRLTLIRGVPFAFCWGGCNFDTSTSTHLNYGMGVALSGRYYFMTFSFGPGVAVSTSLSWDFHGQVRASVMPLKFLGVGISGDFAYETGLGISLTLTVRHQVRPQ